MTRPCGVVGAKVRPPRNTHAHLHSPWAPRPRKRPQIGTDIALQYTASSRRSTMRYVALLLLFCSGTASARDNGQWNNSPINIREWFQSLMQPDNPYMSCCV